jgi:hypothetical protein
MNRGPLSSIVHKVGQNLRDRYDTTVINGMRTFFLVVESAFYNR